MRRRYDSDSISREEKEKLQRRVQWMIEQQKLRQHERLKRRVIEEYDRQRAKKLGLDRRTRSSEHRSRSTSRGRRSRSAESHHRSRLKTTSNSSNNKTHVMSEKLNSSEDNKPFFKGPEEAPKIAPEELRVITVKIHRHIPAGTESNEIRRDIVNPEEITLKRREGEGTKPIFDREELKQAEVQPVEAEEHRTVEAVGAIRKSSSARRTHVKRRSASLSPRRRRSPSPHARPSSRSSHSHRSRSDAHVKPRHNDHYKDHRSDRHHSRSRDSSREDRRRRSSPHSRPRSHSREREHRREERDYSHSRRSDRDYKDKEYRSREYREKSADRSHDRRDRRDSLERHHAPAPYAEPVPYPMYYDAYAPRPVMLGPGIPPIRGPMGRGRMPVPPIRPPYPPRFAIPPFRPPGIPPDPRFGRMY